MENLSNIDLNLLLVLHALLEDPSVARVAKRLNVTSPAISNALARLRLLLNDPLFVRHGKGIVATPRALALAPALGDAMAKLQIALSNSQEISPKTTTRTLTIALADSEQVSVLPSIVSRFSKRMPKATLRVISVDTLIAKGGLAGGAADVAIGPYVPDKELLSEPLYGEEAILVVRRNHPMLKRRSRRRTDCDDLRHIDIHIALGQGGRGHKQAEAAFEMTGRNRDIAVTVPSFAAAAMVAAKSDYVTGLPKRLLHALGPTAPLVPIGSVTVFEMCLLWHLRTHEDLICEEFRNLIVEALRTTHHHK